MTINDKRLNIFDLLSYFILWLSCRNGITV